MALITAEQGRLFLPGLSGTGEDAALTTLIGRVGAAFARHCGYPAPDSGSPTMETATYTRVMDGLGGRELVLEVWPVISVTSIYDDPTGDFTDAQYLVASADYALVEPKRGRVRLKSTSAHGAWGEGRQTIRAVYSAGYATVPDDLAQLAIHALRHWWGLREAQGKTSLSQGGLNVGLRDEDLLPAIVRQGLSPFKLPRAWL